MSKPCTACDGWGVCDDCGGSGLDPDDDEQVCGTCGGTTDCIECDGEGEVEDDHE